LAGKGVVLLISIVTRPRHSGSRGVTLTMMPQRAYVDLPTQMAITSRGISRYSTVSPRTKLLGGIRQESPSVSKKDAGSKFLGSTTAQRAFVKILKRRPRRTS